MPPKTTRISLMRLGPCSTAMCMACRAGASFSLRYDEAAAKLAWRRTVDFFTATLRA